jgi:hypothetical protein
MRGAPALPALALALAGCAATGTEASVRQELEREYAAIVAGFRRDDPAEWIRRLAPDFRLTLFSGAIQDRKWAVDYVQGNAKNFHVVELTMSIRALEIGAEDVVATVEQKSARTFKDEAGPHRLEVGAVQLETWERAPAGGWRLKAVREKDVLYLRKDGKPPGP